MRIYKHKDYNDYVQAQTKTNKQKLNWVFAREHAIDKIVSNYNDMPSFIICHGTRNGTEQKYFRQRWPQANIIGTEISDTASRFEMTIQHDFSNPIEEWIGKADLVYSNSLDHSNDPEKTIQTWSDQLSRKGKMYIEYLDKGHLAPADCLDASLSEILDIMKNSNLELIEIIPLGSQGSDIIVTKRIQND